MYRKEVTSLFLECWAWYTDEKLKNDFFWLKNTKKLSSYSRSQLQIMLDAKKWKKWIYNWEYAEWEPVEHVMNEILNSFAELMNNRDDLSRKERVLQGRNYFDSLSKFMLTREAKIESNIQKRDGPIFIRMWHNHISLRSMLKQKWHEVISIIKPTFSTHLEEVLKKTCLWKDVSDDLIIKGLISTSCDNNYPFKVNVIQSNDKNIWDKSVLNMYALFERVMIETYEWDIIDAPLSLTDFLKNSWFQWVQGKDPFDYYTTLVKNYSLKKYWNLLFYNRAINNWFIDEELYKSFKIHY